MSVIRLRGAISKAVGQAAASGHGLLRSSIQRSVYDRARKLGQSGAFLQVVDSNVGLEIIEADGRQKLKRGGSVGSFGRRQDSAVTAVSSVPTLLRLGRVQDRHACGAGEERALCMMGRGGGTLAHYSVRRLVCGAQARHDARRTFLKERHAPKDVGRAKACFLCLWFFDS